MLLANAVPHLRFIIQDRPPVAEMGAAVRTVLSHSTYGGYMLFVVRRGALGTPRFLILDGLFSRHTTSSSLSLQFPHPSIARSCHRRASLPVNQRDARRSESTHQRNNCLPLYSSCALSPMTGQIRMLPGMSLHRPTLVYADIMILLGSCYACA